MRQKQIYEMVSSACEDCLFNKEGCTVPGGTCWKRSVEGVPGHTVLDILRNTGVISSQESRSLEEETTV